MNVISFDAGSTSGLGQTGLLLLGVMAVLFIAFPILLFAVISRISQEFSDVIKLAIGIAIIPAIILFQIPQVEFWHIAKFGFVVYALGMAATLAPMLRLWQSPEKLNHLNVHLKIATIVFALSIFGFCVALFVPHKVLDVTTELIGVPRLALLAVICGAIYALGQITFAMYLNGIAMSIKRPVVAREVGKYITYVITTLIISVTLMILVALRIITDMPTDLCWLLSGGLCTLSVIWMYQVAQFVEDGLRYEGL